MIDPVIRKQGYVQQSLALFRTSDPGNLAHYWYSLWAHPPILLQTRRSFPVVRTGRWRRWRRRWQRWRRPDLKQVDWTTESKYYSQLKGWTSPYWPFIALRTKHESIWKCRVELRQLKYKFVLRWNSNAIWQMHVGWTGDDTVWILGLGHTHVKIKVSLCWSFPFVPPLGGGFLEESNRSHTRQNCIHGYCSIYQRGTVHESEYHQPGSASKEHDTVLLPLDTRTRSTRKWHLRRWGRWFRESSWNNQTSCGAEEMG